MSPEHEQQIIGRLQTEYQAAKREHALRKIEIDSIGRTFLEIGRTLVERPEDFILMDGERNPTFIKAGELSAELREWRSTVQRLRGQLRDLGIVVD